MNSSQKTLRKAPANLLKKNRSQDNIQEKKMAEISIEDIRILLSCSHSSTDEQIMHRIKKQQVLERNKLFDPQRYFGNQPVSSVEHSSRVHSGRLEEMLSPNQSNNPTRGNSTNKKSVRNSAKLLTGRSPQRLVKQNKQNYQRNVGNNLQKVRAKLKIGRKHAL